MRKIYFSALFIILQFVNYNFSQAAFTDISVTYGMNDPGPGQGTVFLDVNNDGFLDVFLNNNNSLNKLWINNSGAGFSEQSAAYGLSFSGPGRGVSAADYNNDGLIDIMVGQFNSNLILYRNMNGSFTNSTSEAGIMLPAWGGSINWFDYNNDGKVDALFANDGVPYHYNYLFRNDNMISFTNVAYSSGLTDSASTLTVTSVDYDNDGDMDVFCGSQTLIPPNGYTGILYRNNGNGTFTDVTAASGLITMAYSWASDWGDFDNDGDMDLYLGISNGPNQLFKNNGNNTFTESAFTYGVADPTQSYSCGWADYDNDADLDLYVANGSAGIDKLYRNDGASFTDVAAAVGTNDARHSACISWGDFNNDGFLDLYLVNNGSENRLYKNNAGNSNKWVILKLTGTASNRSAIGARVRVKTGSTNQMREVQGGSGGKGQNSLPVEFGIGTASVIDSLVVRWPSGTIQKFAGVNPNVIYSLTEGGVLLGVNQTSSNIPEKFALMQNYPNPFNPVTVISYQLIVSSNIIIKVFDINGKEVKTLVNQKQSAGTYQVDFSGTGYSSGVYFYSLIINGVSVDTKKMLMIK